MPTSTFAVVMRVGPAIAALAGYLVLDQALTPFQLLAIGLRRRRQHRSGAHQMAIGAW
jgi:threonine/homoserine efflux transporter RhtA